MVTRRKIVLAVSGGVDSVVMLDKFWKYADVVAHFDHGIRTDSAEDAEFVRGLAEKYGVEFVLRREKLGVECSEALARERRYRFLREVAGGGGEIWTAHHVDDLVETVAINLIRGTGWRGLCVLDTVGIERPFLSIGWGKKEILEYAAKEGLEWREDETNTNDKYLRNRVRKELQGVTPYEQEILKLWRRQCEIRREVGDILGEIMGTEEVFRREFYRELVEDSDRDVALEILRSVLESWGMRVTWVSVERFLEAVLNYQNGKVSNLPGDVLVRISRERFYLEGNDVSRSG